MHRITIGTAFVGAIAYLAFEVKQLLDGTDGSVARVVLALAATIAIGVYLRRLRARLVAKLTPADRQPPA